MRLTQTKRCTQSRDSHHANYLHIQRIDGFRNVTKGTLDSAMDHTVAVAHERRERIDTRQTRLMANRTIRAKTLLRTKLRNLAQIVWRGLIHPIQPITP